MGEASSSRAIDRNLMCIASCRSGRRWGLRMQDVENVVDQGGAIAVVRTRPQQLSWTPNQMTCPGLSPASACETLAAHATNEDVV